VFFIIPHKKTTTASKNSPEKIGMAIPQVRPAFLAAAVRLSKNARILFNTTDGLPPTLYRASLRCAKCSCSLAALIRSAAPYAKSSCSACVSVPSKAKSRYLSARTFTMNVIPRTCSSVHFSHRLYPPSAMQVYRSTSSPNAVRPGLSHRSRLCRVSRVIGVHGLTAKILRSFNKINNSS